jgi:density-regulated protein DRP1
MVVPRIVLYCAKCGMPPEYCEYGPDYETHCLPWLRKAHPDLSEAWNGSSRENVSRTMSDNISAPEAQREVPITESKTIEPWTTEERLRSFYEKYVPEKVDTIPSLLEKYAGKEEKLFAALVKKYGPEPEDPYVVARWGRQEEEVVDENVGNQGDVETEEGEVLSGGISGVSMTDDVKKRRGVGAKKTSKLDTRVIIQKITRNRKKAVTHVVGLDTVPDLILKDAAKAFSKTFAGSSSVKDTPQGKEIIIQGDHQDTCAEMIVTKFKVPASVVFLDIDGEFVPFG